MLQTSPLVLTEGSVVERLRRDPASSLDPEILQAAFVCTASGRNALKRLYRSYLNVGREWDLPIIVHTPTWRANPERAKRAGYSVATLNRDGASFVQALRQEYGDYADKILLAGLIACRYDAYRPAEALAEDEAQLFHAEQLGILAEAGVDFLFAATLPAFSEALGIARAMAATHVPFALSFVLRPSGMLLDGTPLSEAVAQIDRVARPDFYLVNCVHPEKFAKAFDTQIRSFPGLKDRVIGLQGNTSRLSPEELEGLSTLDETEPDIYGQEMAELRQKFGLKILGGCCGTDERHIAAIARFTMSTVS